jgi:glycosyltransferase involved in cell wall biosynthesis
LTSELPQIIGFGLNEWHTPWWVDRQHLLTRLAARGWPVVYSTGPQYLWERNTDKWRRASLFHDFDVFQAGGDAIVRVDRPGKYMPLRRHEGMWSDLVVSRHAAHLMKGLAGGDRRRIVYLWHPSFWPYVAHLDADYVVFHIHDAWNATAWSSRQKRDLQNLVERADLVIATAENMCRALPGVDPSTVQILPHGVDFEAVVAGAAAPCPADLAGIPRPRIGYTGRVNLKLDFPAIIEAATMRPDWHWVFVGPTGVGTSYTFDHRPEVKALWQRVQQMDNIHLLGVKDRTEIPSYLHHFDVLSLPYHSSVVGYPTKLFEYFASGKPIVSWRGENVHSVSSLIESAEGAREWVAAVGRAIHGPHPSTADERIEFARKEDWNARTDALETWLIKMMGSSLPSALVPPSAIGL